MAGVPVGGSLLLRQGDSWELTAPLTLSAWGSGVPDESTPSAVFGSYPDGQNSSVTGRPSISRVLGSPVGPILYCVDCAGLVIKELEVSGGEQGLLFGYSSPSTKWGGITITDCFVHDIRGVRSGGDPKAWGSAIGFNTSERTGMIV